MATITVFGAGMMGSALCVPLADAGHVVRLVGTHLDCEIIDELRRSGVHGTLRVQLPGAVSPYQHDQLAEALAGADGVALGVSSAGVDWAAEQLGRHLQAPLPVAMITKGLCYDAGRLVPLPDHLAGLLGASFSGSVLPVAVAGPCIAGELARRVETCAVLTGRDHAVAECWRSWLSTDYYRLWVSDDVVGVEVCAALKNAYALGIALPSGQHVARGGCPGSVARHNAESALFAQSLFEMQAMIRWLGGDPASASWLPGAGDLDVTCNGGRTGRFGHLLGQGMGRDRAVEQMQGATLESVEILRVLRQGIRSFERQGTLRRGAFPLLEHLAAIALDDAPVAPPFQSFFDDATSAILRAGPRR